MDDKLRIDSSQVTAIHSWLGDRKEEMAALLAELVAIPTENPPGNNFGACADLLEQRIQQLGLDCKPIAPAGARNQPEGAPASLIANYGTGERTLYFHGHYDVVPAQSGNSSSQFAKNIFCLDAAPAT